MASAAYLALLEQASVEWTVLAEVQLRQALRGWTSEGSSAYSVPFSLYTHSTALRLDRGLYRGLDAVWVGRTPLTLLASVAAVKAAAGSYYYDAATEKLYVRTSDSVNPDTLALIQALGTLRLATSPPDFSDQPPYDAQLDADNLPSVEASRPDLLRGLSKYPSGNLTLLNADGFWDPLCDVTPAAGWLWLNNTVRLLLGGDALAYSEYEVIATMQMSDVPKCADLSTTIQLRSISNAIGLSFPRHTLQDWYSSSVSLLGGTPSASLPVWFGVVREAPLVFVGDNGTRNKWISGDPFILTAVTYSNLYAVERATGTRTALTDIASGGTDYLYLGGADRAMEVIKAWDAATYDIIADVSQSGQSCGAMALQILQACGIPSALIDTASFTQADLDNAAPLGLWIGVRQGSDLVSALRSGADLLDEVGRSTFLDVVFASTGLWTATVWDPSFDLATTRVLTDDDLFTCDAPQRVQVLSSGVKVQYARAVYADTWSETASSRSAALAEQNTDSENTKTVQTCLVNLVDAATHAQRCALIDSRPTQPLRIRTGPVLMNYSVGDKVRIVRARGPASGGTLDRIFEIETLSKSLKTLECVAMLGNQRGLGEAVKRVAPDGTPDWASASADERRQYAFVADDVTHMVDPSDRTTYEQAVIW